LYEGESNENHKSVLKIRNTTRLSCKLATVTLMVWRVADRWQYDGGTQHDGTAMVWRRWPHLQHAPKRNSVQSFVFYEVKVWNPSTFMDECKFSTVMHVCHYSKCTNGVGSS